MAPRRKTAADVPGPPAKKPRASTPRTDGAKKGRKTNPKAPTKSARKPAEKHPTEPRLIRAEPTPTPGCSGEQRAPGESHLLSRDVSEQPERRAAERDHVAEEQRERAYSPSASLLSQGRSPASSESEDQPMEDQNPAPETSRANMRPEHEVHRHVNERENSVASASANQIDRLASVLESTFRAIREQSLSEQNVNLLNRLTTKALPSFAGDPLEWLYFKQTYEATTQASGFNEQENVSRLFRALQGEARKTVSSLLATGRDATAIMKTLELHYGNKRIIARKLLEEIKSLPDLESGRIRFTQFASKLKNAVSAIRDLGLAGCLGDLDLIANVAGKLPYVLKRAFNKYTAAASDELPELVRLANFLEAEAELEAAGGLCDLEVAGPSTKTSNRARHAATERQTRVYAVRPEAPREPNVEQKKASGGKCLHCNRAGHSLDECRAFRRESVNRRWYYARKWQVCYKCLKVGHKCNDCTQPSCFACRRQHHAVLHDAARFSRPQPATAPAAAPSEPAAVSRDTEAARAERGRDIDY